MAFKRRVSHLLDLGWLVEAIHMPVQQALVAELSQPGLGLSEHGGTAVAQRLQQRARPALKLRLRRVRDEQPVFLLGLGVAVACCC